MKKIWLLPLLPGLLVLAAVAFVVVLLVVKVLWAWTIPDLFPGAVEQGIVAGTGKWDAAGKVAIFADVIAGVAGARAHKK